LLLMLRFGLRCERVPGPLPRPDGYAQPQGHFRPA
jgi:hypothetical protein